MTENRPGLFRGAGCFALALCSVLQCQAVNLRPREAAVTVEARPVEVVVAAWDNNVTWDEELLSRIVPPPRVRLYCGPQMKDPRCTFITDHGAEEYAYLTHIVENYDRLAPITVFSTVSVYDDVY